MDWKKELNWVGKDGLIVFDHIGMGKTQDQLRKEGFSVFGGCELGEKLEDDRQYGYGIFSAAGMKTKEVFDFCDIDKLVAFIKKNPRKWVVKQNGFMDKGLCYVGDLKNGADVISLLENYKKIFKNKNVHFNIQERVEGIEIATGRFFNGSDWIGPICINIEHKNLFNDDIGPKTHEMGNLMWYEENEKNRLYQETLAKIKPHLKKIKFKGYFDINCIVSEDGAWPLEATARLGQPTAQIQDTIHISPWGDLMKAIADGKKYTLNYKKGYATIAFLGTPPYPYANRSNLNSPKGLEIFFKGSLSEEELNRIYFEEVNIFRKNGIIKYIISGNAGYIAHVSGFGRTAGEARKKCIA
ncbi:phosphoribosylamine-glycine ligase [Candidatus Magnetobacterium bavaricum]|uniref:Phosphoribosylamine-glycine ligase n=1 Tax=Candidatus Magnetobacterium bavaricum TaxID=29290 RepID=A0A0F3H1A9_9BACT|nr:phosphoribosylamine-glycine ligase [Candidatus Magnetobacterium bavaricum]